jgi:hypothetical protein
VQIMVGGGGGYGGVYFHPDGGMYSHEGMPDRVEVATSVCTANKNSIYVFLKKDLAKPQSQISSKYVQSE